MFNLFKSKNSIESIEEKLNAFLVSSKDNNINVSLLREKALYLEKEIDFYKKIKKIEEMLRVHGSVILWSYELMEKQISDLSFWTASEEYKNIIQVSDSGGSVKFLIGFNQGEDSNEIVVDRVLLDTKSFSGNLDDISDIEISENLVSIFESGKSYNVETFRPGEWLIDFMKCLLFFEEKYLVWGREIVNLSNKLEETQKRSNFSSSD